MSELGHAEELVPVGGRPRLPEPQRRQALIRAAENVFLEQGYAAANMDDVARGAGMSKKTLYRLFASKEALFEAVMDDQMAPLLVAMPEETEGELRQGLIALLQRVAGYLLTERNVSFCRLIISEVKRVPGVTEAFWRATKTHGEDAVEQFLAIHVASGRLRLEDVPMAAGMLFGLTIGEPHMWMLLGQRSALDQAEIAHRVAIAVDIFLDGALIRES